MDNKPFLDFDSKKVLVTGASSGIGRAVAIELSHHNAELILLGRNMEALKETASSLDTNDYHIINLDLQDLSRIVPTIRGHSKDVGRIYGFCHCAGVVETIPLSSYKLEGLREMLDVNLIAGLELARVISRRDIMEKEGGAFLFISSVYSHVGKPGQIGYTASKGAISSAVRAMAMELARRKIRVNALSPGLVRTRMVEESFSKLTEEQVQQIESSFPLGTGTPEDVARAAAFVLAPQNPWITGIDLVIDGGFTAQ